MTKYILQLVAFIGMACGLVSCSDDDNAEYGEVALNYICSYDIFRDGSPKSQCIHIRRVTENNHVDLPPVVMKSGNKVTLKLKVGYTYEISPFVLMPEYNSKDISNEFHTHTKKIFKGEKITVGIYSQILNTVDCNLNERFFHIKANGRIENCKCRLEQYILSLDCDSLNNLLLTSWQLPLY